MPKNNKVDTISFVRKYRLIIFIVMFLIVLPILVMTIFYSTTYIKYSSVYINNDTKEKIGKTTSFNNLEYITFETKLSKIDEIIVNNDKTDKNTPKKQNKYTYTFTNKYTVKTNPSYTVKNVALTYVLASKWIDFNIVGSEYTASEYYRDYRISFDKNMPLKTPFFLPNLSVPDTYIKIKVTIISKVNGFSTDKNYFVKYNARKDKPALNTTIEKSST